MRISLCLFLVGFSFSNLYAQNSDTSLISITNFKLFQGTYSWRGTDTYFDMTNWDTSPYTEGHLMQKNGTKWIFRLNYRLLYPNSYDKNYKDGYPLLIMLHGAGERGNCWDTNCYCAGCDPNGEPVAEAKPEFLNNDHMLQLGGRPYYDAVNRAGSKKVGDPTLHARGFPGFVFFPQCENAWGSESAGSAVSYALRTIRLLVKEHNIDPDRIYLAGLSMGGQGALKAMSMADWLFAAAITMSPISYYREFDYEGTKNIPMWIFQGGLDLNPRPAQTEKLIKGIKEAGGSVRYTFYPEAGHNTWSRAFGEPDFFSWLLQFRKNQIYVRYNYPHICETTGDGSELILPAGFPAYQWKLNDEIISDAKANIYVAKSAGTYRGRFSRVENPTEGDWNDWSEPVVVTSSSPVAPDIQQMGTTFLPDLNGSNTAVLYTTTEYPYYIWEKNEQQTSLPDSSIAVINSNVGNGAYRLRAADFSGCLSAATMSKPVYFSNSAKVNNKMLPTDLAVKSISSSKVYVSWKDVSGFEDGFELWRKNKSKDEPWKLAALTKPNVTFHYDTALVPGSTYLYKIRAINSTQRSDYFPGNAENESVVIELGKDNDAPLPPQNLSGELIQVNAISLKWNKGWDESGIKEYRINFQGRSINTGSLDTTYVLKDVEPNEVYTITVNTVDISGNVSAPSNQISIVTKISGLFYKHSTGAWTSLTEQSLIDTWSNPEYTGRVETLTLSPRVQEDYFNFEFDGYIYIAQAGSYKFYINSNEGSKLFIDNVEVIDFDGLHGRCTGDANTSDCPNGWGRPSETLQLERGPHRFKVQMFEYTGGQDLRVMYSGPDTYGNTITIPDAVYSSGSTPTQYVPARPASVEARPTGMTQIEVTWDRGDARVINYEIYRSRRSDGPFVILNSVNGDEFTDTDLLPGERYYYKIRGLSETAASNFSSTVNATTFSDDEAPSVPQNLIAENGNAGRVILKWEPSTDNVGIIRYEIWANGKLLMTSPVPAAEVILPEVGEIYEFYVVAVDISNNKSNRSNTVTNEVFVTDIDNGITSDLILSLHPNPQSKNPATLKVRTTRRSPCRISVTDMLGREIYLQEFIPRQDETIIEIDKNLSPGVFIITLMREDTSVSEKLVFRP